MKPKTIHLLLIAILIALIYANSLPNGFALDDRSLLIENPAVHGLRFDNIMKVFTSVPNKMEYLPIRDITYMLDYSIWGLSPLGYHLSNVLYYLFTCIVIYFFLLKLLSEWTERQGIIALFATLIFAAHPVHVESVAGISQRKDIVSGLFFFLSLYMYIKYKETSGRRIYLLSLFLFSMAVLSKVTSVVLPAIVLLLEFVCFKGSVNGPGRKTLRALPFFAIAAAGAILNYSLAQQAGVVKQTMYGSIFGGTTARIYTSFVAVFQYLKMLLLPYPLRIQHTFELSGSFFEPRVVFSVTGLLLLIYLAHLFKRDKAVIAFSILWYVISISPVIGLIPTSTLIAERYLFLPSFGFCLFIAWFFIGRLLRFLPKAVPVLVMSIAILASGAYCMDRNRDWKDHVTLLNVDMQKQPYSLDLEMLLLREYMSEGRFVDAFELAGKAKKQRPDDIVAGITYDFLTAYYLYSRQSYDAALIVLDNIRSAEDVADIYYLKGLIYESNGIPQDAIRNYSRALEAGNIFYFSRKAFEADISSRLESLGRK